MELQNIFKFDLNQKVYYGENQVHEGLIIGLQYTVDEGVFYYVKEPYFLSWVHESELFADKEAAKKFIENKEKELDF